MLMIPPTTTKIQERAIQVHYCTEIVEIDVSVFLRIRIITRKRNSCSSISKICNYNGRIWTNLGAKSIWKWYQPLRKTSSSLACWYSLHTLHQSFNSLLTTDRAQFSPASSPLYSVFCSALYSNSTCLVLPFSLTNIPSRGQLSMIISMRHVRWDSPGNRSTQSRTLGWSDDTRVGSQSFGRGRLESLRARPTPASDVRPW